MLNAEQYQFLFKYISSNGKIVQNKEKNPILGSLLPKGNFS